MTGKNEDKVIQAARQVFQRYGFKRVTMGDIAEAAGMSRPALYLVFASKEEILSAVVAEVFASMLEEIRQGISRVDTPEKKLTLAFDVWCVRPFEMVQQSPDAKDLYESTLQFATEVTTRAFSEFEGLVGDIIDSVRKRKAGIELSSEQIARILASAMGGFKGVAKNRAQLSELIAGLIAMVLQSLK